MAMYSDLRHVSCIIPLVLLIGCGRTPTEPAISSLDKQRPASESLEWSQRVQKASAILASGDVVHARRVLTALLVEKPNDLQALMLMGRALEALNDVEGAVSIQDQLSDLRPAHRHQFQLQSANLLAQAGRISLARNRYESLLARDPDAVSVRGELIQVLDAYGYTVDANSHVRVTALTSDPTQDMLIGLIFPTRSWFKADAAKEAKETSLASQRMQLAYAFLIGGDPVSGLECLGDCKRENGESDVAAFALRGRLLALANMNDQLAEWAASGTSEHENYPDFWIGMGHHALAQNPTVSADCFLHAIDIEPHSIAAHDGLMLALERADKVHLVKTVRERRYALDHIIRDALTLRREKSPPGQLYIDIATQLMAVGRPIEAVCWQAIALKRFAPKSKQLADIQNHKARILRKFARGVDRDVILMGIDRNDFASATEWIETIRESSGRMQLERVTNPETADLIANQVSPVFTDVATNVGVDFAYRNAVEPVERFFRIHEGMGSGVACFDYDLDGNIDLYFCQGVPRKNIATDTDRNNCLYRNIQTSYRDITDDSGSEDSSYSTGITSGDWNQDGFDDLLVANLGQNSLLINQGDGSFRRALDLFPETDHRYSISVAIADVTNDALPDIIEINYVDDKNIYDPIEIDSTGKPLDLPGPLQFDAAGDRVYESAGDGSIRTRSLGDQHSELYRPGLALLVGNLNDTPGNEIFVANDLRANQMWVAKRTPQGSRVWHDMAVLNGVAYGTSGKPLASMGIAAADFDMNGHLDLHITNFENEWSNHYLQNEQNTFTDAVVSHQLNLASHQMLGFGTQPVDYDNNGLVDIVVGNGHIDDVRYDGSNFRMPTQIFTNLGSHFQPSTVGGDEEYWGRGHLSRGMAYLDWNRDGRTDIVVTDLKERVSLLENRTSTDNHWLKLKLVGVDSERGAIGARVTVEADAFSSTHFVKTGDGYMSKNESTLFIGLGQNDEVNSVHVHWPNGRVETHLDLACDQTWCLIEGQSQPWTFEE